MRIAQAAHRDRALRQPGRAWLALACAIVVLGAGGLLLPGADGQHAAIAQNGGAGAGGAAQQGAAQPEFVTDYLIVRVKPGVESARDANGRWSFRLGANATQGMHAAAATALKRDASAAQLAIRSALQSAKASEIRRAGVWQNAERARRFRLDRYHKIMLPPGTTVAEAQALAEKLKAQSPLIEHAELDAFGTTAGTIVPNDADFDMQYSLLNMTTPGADISATEAWPITTGAPQMILAILDSGVSAHAEISGRLVPGINTVDGSANTVDGCNHGTHVTGIAAANTDNGFGIAGVNWNIRIMPIRVLTGCSGVEADLADGLMWAADNGAHVANMSLQYSSGTQFLLDGVNYARDAGVVLCAAAGNFGVSGGVAFPGRWDETMAVAATDFQDEHWINSNSGPEVDFAAGGVSVWSLSNTGGYTFISGTSMATPHVAGLASLMLTVDPTLTHDEIRTILIDTADDVETPGFDNLTGHGRINAHAALLATLERLGIPGDIDNDESVDELDRAALEALLGVEWGDVSFNSRADLNHDGTIDAADEALFDELLPACPGDIVSSATFQPPADGVVDAADLAYLLGAWGTNPGSLADVVSSATFQPPPDGFVDAADLAYMLGSWGPCE